MALAENMKYEKKIRGLMRKSTTFTDNYQINLISSEMPLSHSIFRQNISITATVVSTK